MMQDRFPRKLGWDVSQDDIKWATKEERSSIYLSSFLVYYEESIMPHDKFFPSN